MWSSELLGDVENEGKATEMLRLAAGDVCRVLLKQIEDGTNNNTAMESSDETKHAEIRCIIEKVVHCPAGLQARTYISNDSEEDHCAPSLFHDVPLLVQFCVVLADAWRSLSARRCGGDETRVGDDDALFVDGALAAYGGALAVASTTKTRALRAKERRRIEKETSALEK